MKSEKTSRLWPLQVHPAPPRADMGGLRGSLAAQKSVKDEAEAFLREKTVSELLQLKASIESKLKDSGSHDTEFMEEVSASLVRTSSPPPYSDAPVPQVHGRIFVAVARARVAEVYSHVLASKQQLSSANATHESDAVGGEHAQDVDSAVATGGGDAAHKAAAKFIESQRLEKGVGSDEEVRSSLHHVVIGVNFVWD
jgi:hypothetical protein